MDNEASERRNVRHRGEAWFPGRKSSAIRRFPQQTLKGPIGNNLPTIRILIDSAMKQTISAEDFASIYTHAFPSTMKFLQSRGVQSQAASDLAQAAWVRGWECRKQLRNHSALHSWVNTIAWNLFRNAKSRTPEMLSLSELNMTSHDLPVEVKILADELLRDLDIGDRETLQACFFLGYTDIELAHHMRMTRGTIRQRVHRLRQRLKKGLRVYRYRKTMPKNMSPACAASACPHEKMNATGLIKG